MQGVQNKNGASIQPKPITFRESAYAISFLDLSPINLNRLFEIIFWVAWRFSFLFLKKFWIFFGDPRPDTRIIV